MLDSRATADGVRRRRQCGGCRRRFTTYERPSAPGLRVVKRSDKMEPFDAAKLQTALRRIGRNRAAITEEVVCRIARDIEAELVDASAKSVRSGQIAVLALRRLAEIDRISYDRLAVNYIDETGRLRTEPPSGDPGELAQLGLFVLDEPPSGPGDD